MRKRHVFSFIIIFICLSSCRDIQSFTDELFNIPPRKIYARDFDKDDPSYMAWQLAFVQAKQCSLQVSIPHSVQVVNQNKPFALGYKLTLQEGEELQVYAQLPDSVKIFIDFFQLTDGVLGEKSLMNKLGEHAFTKAIQETGEFQLVIQPQIGLQTNFSLQIFTQPTLDFPVAGEDNTAIKSFWGAARDGGKRKHEGVDIFAARGTELIAATDGVIFRTGNYGLGGKQVWLRDGLFGHSLYYAHLDSILVNRGQSVKRGDVVGLVGNTGNARTTPPHLHFGIYGSGGAVDPYPFIQLRDTPQPVEVNETSVQQIALEKANMRIGPGTEFDQISQLAKGDSVIVISEGEQWLQVKTPDGNDGFVFTSLLGE